VGWKKECDRCVEKIVQNIGEKRKNNLPLTIQSTFIIPMPFRGPQAGEVRIWVFTSKILKVGHPKESDFSWWRTKEWIRV